MTRTRRILNHEQNLAMMTKSSKKKRDEPERSQKNQQQMKEQKESKSQLTACCLCVGENKAPTNRKGGAVLLPCRIKTECELLLELLLAIPEAGREEETKDEDDTEKEEEDENDEEEKRGR